MRWGLPPALLLVAALAASSAHARPAIGQGCDGRPTRLGDRPTAWAAYANHGVQTFARPGGRRLHGFGRLNANGVSTVFGVLAVVRDPNCEPAWYHVQLPIRPNGATGFVAADAVTVYPVHTRIEIDISKRRLAFFRGTRLVFTATAGVGTSGTPTPTGSYYVNQRLYALDASGPYGPGAVGISAFSPVLTDWAQGGPIAVHGTNDPASVGRFASHGCIRVQNRVVLRLLRVTETGAPVIIRA